MKSSKCAESVVQRTDLTPLNPAAQATFAQSAREYDHPHKGAGARINAWCDVPQRGAVSGLRAARVRHGDTT